MDILLLIVFLTALTLIFFIISLHLYRKAQIKKSICNYMMLAECIKVEECSSNGEIWYTPIFEYEYQQQKYQYKLNVSSGKQNIKVGDKRKIFINPNNPSESAMNFDLYFFVIISAGAAVVLLIMICAIIYLIINKEINITL
ncbi:MAG: hypothetical protein SOY42_10035 [Clostridium sp.]|nr:hypothetical protein [Clostridium sp.]